MEKLDEQLKRIKELFTEQEGYRASGGGGTSTDSSGQYMSATAWQAGGILTKDGRENNLGEVPVEVDLTKDSATVTLNMDDVDFTNNPHDTEQVVDIIDDLIGQSVYGEDDYDGPTGSHDKRDPKDGEYTNPLDGMKPCCEPCGDGMWKNCHSDECIYTTISDCELVSAGGESNMGSLSLGDIWGEV
tara:strand:+ start:3419 stop:3979 length:561 start_codon:yes stop_codon:yes gene_type:complete